MSFLKKLKEIVGDAAIIAKIEAELNGKDIIVNDGSYIPKEKFNDVNDKLKAVTTERDKFKTDYETAKAELDKTGDSQKTTEQKIADLEKKIADKEAEASLIKKEAILKESLTAAGVKNPKNLKLLTKEFDLAKLELDENGAIKGFDDKVKVLKEDYKPLFGETIITGDPANPADPNTHEPVKEMSTEDFYSKDVFGKN